MACGFDFEQVYGECGRGFIEVHHINPLSVIAEDAPVNPKTDLVCLCANCHCMIHRLPSGSATLEQLKLLVENNMQ